MIPAVKIVFRRAEGASHELGTFTFEGPTCWEDCERHISYARRTAPAQGGYDKCDVSITFAPDADGDSFTYKLRYDMQHPDRCGYNDTLARHVRDSWFFYSLQYTPAHLTRERHEQLIRNLKVDTAQWARMIKTYAVPGLERAA